MLVAIKEKKKILRSFRDFTEEMMFKVLKISRGSRQLFAGYKIKEVIIFP